MALVTTLLDEDDTPGFSAARQDVDSPFQRLGGSRHDVGDQVDELGIVELGSLDPAGLDRVRHDDAVIQHGGSHQDG